MKAGKGKLLMTGGLILMGAAVIWQRIAGEKLRTEVGVLRSQNRDPAGLRAENQRLGKFAAELQSYRGDAAEVDRLRDETTALVNRLRGAAKKRPLADENTPGTAAAGANNSYVYELADVDQKPEVKSQGSRPVYPTELKRAGIGGEAVVSFIIDVSGEVRDVQGVKSTHPDFGRAAIEAIKKWKFTSGQKAGLPVNVRMQAPITFNPAPPGSQVPAWF